ncbi:MAG: hypothetical protein QXI16_03215 [Sulfolobaceae archaeon]
MVMGTNQWLFTDGYAVENLNHPPSNPSQVWKNVASDVNYAQQMDQQYTTQTNNLWLYIIIGILVLAIIIVGVYAITKR